MPRKNGSRVLHSKKHKQPSKMFGVMKKEDQALAVHRIPKKNKDDNA